MHDILLFLHVAGAIFWMGGMAFMVLALRPALAMVEPPLRVKLVEAILRRFFVVVAASIAMLALTGAALFADMQPRPAGVHVMAGLGLLMMLVFGHIYFVPWRRLRAASSREDWPVAGAATGQIALLAKVNLGLGWVAIAAVILWH